MTDFYVTHEDRGVSFRVHPTKGCSGTKYDKRSGVTFAKPCCCTVEYADGYKLKYIEGVRA